MIHILDLQLEKSKMIICQVINMNFRFQRDEVRAILHTELHRFLWDDLERMLEHMRHLDNQKTGYLPRKMTHYAIKACRIPIDEVLIERILDV